MDTGKTYKAILLWGIKFERPQDDGSDDKYDEKWEDVGYKWEMQHEEETGIMVDEIPFSYDGNEDDGHASHFMFPKEFIFKSERYGCSEINIPEMDELVIILKKDKLKKACEILGIEYQEPKWYLMTEGA